MILDRVTIRRIEPGDAAALVAFYNALSDTSQRLGSNYSKRYLNMMKKLAGCGLGFTPIFDTLK